MSFDNIGVQAKYEQISTTKMGTLLMINDEWNKVSKVLLNKKKI